MNTPVSSYWVGIDISKETFDAAIAPTGSSKTKWNQLAHRCFPNTPQGVIELLEWLQETAPGHTCLGLCLEHTGCYTRAFLHAYGALAPESFPMASAVNPLLPKAFLRTLSLRDKTDRSDACALSLYGLMHEPAPTPLIGVLHQQLRDLFRTRCFLVEQSTCFKNRLKTSAKDDLSKKRLEGVLTRMEEEIAAIDETVQETISKDERLREDYKRLKTVPGIGKVCALMILSEFGDLRTWSRREVVSYAGLFARSYESGSSVRSKPRMVKGGGRIIRQKLYLGATSLLKHETKFTPWLKQLEERGKKKMQCIGALMRKILMLARAVICSGKDYDPNFSLA
ncbi:MAG: IS110 family transposase [Candidatus Sumerlaeia bacterium]|nr:IS110 family transposase [Candidatus Sumerlaeia bacterium]